MKANARDGDQCGERAMYGRDLRFVALLIVVSLAGLGAGQKVR